MTGSAESPKDQGLKLLREGSAMDAVDLLLKAMAENPSDVDLYLYLGLAYVQNHELDKAVEILEQATDVAPTSAKVHYNLGVAYQRAHNITQAKDEYLRALGLDPTYDAAKQALDLIVASQGT